MFCSKCGSPISTGQKFCSNCGSPIFVNNDQQIPPPINPIQGSDSGIAFYDRSNPIFDFLEAQSLKTILIVAIIAVFVTGFISGLASEFGGGENHILSSFIGAIAMTAIHIAIVCKAANKIRYRIGWVVLGAFALGILGVLAVGDSGSGLGTLGLFIAYSLLLFTQGCCKEEYRMGCIFICIGLAANTMGNLGASIFNFAGAICLLLGYIMLFKIDK